MKELPRIKALRIERNISQKSLADILEITQTSYSCYETGRNRVPLSVLLKLCSFYGVSLDYILGLTDEQFVDE